VRQYGAQIRGIGSCVPDKVLDNAYFESYLDTSDEWILTRTGIRERRVVANGQANSSLSIPAAERAMADAGLCGKDVNLIIVATVTPDMVFPSTASIIQEAIGANAAAFDLEAGCSGFMYGAAVAAQFIENGAYEHALVIGCDLLSVITNYQDRNSCVLFGDAAGAAVLSRCEPGRGIVSFQLGSDGSGAEVLKMEAGGSRMPTTPETAADKRLHSIYMEGREVFKFAVTKMPEASLAVMEAAGWSSDDVDLFVPHQANIRIIEAAAKRLNVTQDRVYVNVDRYGNTSAGSIPVALDEAYRQGRLKRGDKVVCVGFGAGLSWAAVALVWTKDPPAS
jgi:3-oxoacyl-[acyl-carrier-protein] synthase-3